MPDSLLISDTSSFILLDKIDEMELLRQCFKHVYTTPTVAREFGSQLPDWIIVQEVRDRVQLERLHALMDVGEASVLALAKEIGDCFVLIDDRQARRYAESIGQKFLGTLGLILRAKRLGVIPAVRPLVEKVEATNFWANRALLEFIIQEAGE